MTWGSKHGGTEGIGRMIGQSLEAHGFDVVTASVDRVTQLDTFDAVIVGGSLYANRWPSRVCRFVSRNVAALRKVPVWLFSSGPLDDSADREEISAPTEIAVLGERVGARGHVTFGGRLEPDVKGFPAAAMARTHSGDWRNPERIRAWAEALAVELREARPGTPVEPAGRSLVRLLAHGVVGWGLCAATLLILLRLVSLSAALVIHAIAAALLFTAVAWTYFRVRGAREPLTTALTWTATVVVLDLVVAGAAQHGWAMFESVAGTWIPFAAIFLVTWMTGLVMSMLPGPKGKGGEKHVPHEPVAHPHRPAA